MNDKIHSFKTILKIFTVTEVFAGSGPEVATSRLKRRRDKPIGTKFNSTFYISKPPVNFRSKNVHYRIKPVKIFTSGKHFHFRQTVSLPVKAFTSG